MAYGKEKLFIHPKLMQLLSRDSNEFQTYPTARMCLLNPGRFTDARGKSSMDEISLNFFKVSSINFPYVMLYQLAASQTGTHLTSLMKSFKEMIFRSW
jgi:hypothetical protein